MIHALQPFCPKFTPRVRDFLTLVMQAHADAAGANMPASTTAAIIQGQLGSTFESAVIAAMNTVGGKHAPITKTRAYWFYDLQALKHDGWQEPLRQRIADGEIIPGFGHGKFKDKLAPELEAADRVLRAQFPQDGDFIAKVTKIVHETKPHLQPNIALYTALACELAEMRYGVESLVLIYSRLPIWAMAWGGAIAGQ